MGRKLAVGALLVLGFAIAFAPAGLVRVALEPVRDVSLLEPTGTLWRGHGQLTSQGVPLGRLSWDLRPVTILSGALGYDFSLAGQDLDLQGTVSAGIDQSVAVQASGRVGSTFVNELLAPYAMRITGPMELDGVGLRFVDQRPTEAGGTAQWQGGPVSYRLSGRNYHTALPPMQAELGPGPEAIVRQQDQPQPLILAELQPNGFAKVGITKGLTRLLDNPWPGAAGDAEVVLQVEEKIF